jgi:hypothetical protein
VSSTANLADAGTGAQILAALGHDEIILRRKIDRHRR